MTRSRTLLWLFGTNLFISAFTFGGGYVVIPMIRKFYVEKKQYFEEEELMKIAAIAQSSPGAIAINTSALAGWRVAGWGGLLVSCLAAILPPLLILSLVSLVYAQIQGHWLIQGILHGMEAGVAALIVDLIVDMYRMVLREKQIFLSLLAPAVFLLHYVFGVHVALLLLGSAALCALRARIVPKEPTL